MLYVIWVIRHTVLLIYISILFAVIFSPTVKGIQSIRIRRRSPSRGVAIVILIACVAAVLAVVVFVMLPPMLQQTQSLLHYLPIGLEQLMRRAQQLPFGHRLADINLSTIVGYVGSASQSLVVTFKNVAGGLFDVFLLAVLTAYFILDGRQSLEWGLSLVPADHRARLRSSLRAAAVRAQKWLGGQLLLMLILGSLCAVVFGILHLRYFYAVAVFAGLANFIPVVGPIATVVLASVVAALDSWLKMLGVIIFLICYLQIENAYLYPRIMRSNVGLSGVAIVAALAIGGSLAGVFGALVAVPTAAIVATLVAEYLGIDTRE